MTNASNDLERLELACDVARRLRGALGRVVVGQQDVIEQMLITLVSGGHALLVGVPGLAKTLLVACLARALRLSFGRVQFTPDLLPADITGTDVLQEQDGQRSVRFAPGPIFHNLVLADEVNRTPPKTQAALLQAMQERQVTAGNATHPLPVPFQVFATRNPIELEGTYPLPEAQRDRFLLEIQVGYPSETEERQVAVRPTSPGAVRMSPVVEPEELAAVAELIPRVPVTPEAVALAVSIVRATRPTGLAASSEVREYVRYGAGPRGSQALVLAAKAHAALRGEAAADLDDVRAMVRPALRHRLVLSYRADADGLSEVDLLDRLAKAIRPPTK